MENQRDFGYPGGKMTKNIVLTLMLMGLSFSLFAVQDLAVCEAEPDSSYALTKLLCRVTEPKYSIIHAVINPKFVPDNFYCNTLDEISSHHFQIPETLLKELTNEELVRYILSTTEYMMSAHFTVRNKDFSGFNGYTELISRPGWLSDIIQLPQKYLDEGHRYMLFHSLRFITMYDVYTQMTLPQQQQILAYLKELLLIKSPSPDFKIVGPVGGDLTYLAAVITKDYYPSGVGPIIELIPGTFQTGIEHPRSLVLIELQKAIDSGKHIEVGYEKY